MITFRERRIIRALTPVEHYATERRAWLATALAVVLILIAVVLLLLDPHEFDPQDPKTWMEFLAGFLVIFGIWSAAVAGWFWQELDDSSLASAYGYSRCPPEDGILRVQSPAEDRTIHRTQYGFGWKAVMLLLLIGSIGEFVKYIGLLLDFM